MLCLRLPAKAGHVTIEDILIARVGAGVSVLPDGLTPGATSQIMLERRSSKLTYAQPAGRGPIEEA